MQIVGFALLGFIVWFGFGDRGADQVISAFDLHAGVMVLVGSSHYGFLLRTDKDRRTVATGTNGVRVDLHDAPVVHAGAGPVKRITNAALVEGKAV